MSEHFQIPRKRLQKPVTFPGRNCLDAVSDYIAVRKRAKDTKTKHAECDAPNSETMWAAEAVRRADAAVIALKAVSDVDETRRGALLSNVKELTRRKKELSADVEKIETNYLQNLKYRENDKLETLSKIDAYVESTREFKREKEKQDILIRIGLIMEALLDQLAPFEEMLGRLSLQENAFKSKADTLAVKKDILMGRMAEMNARLKDDLLQREEIKKQVFKTNFLLRESSHYKMNLINRLIETDTRTKRVVLDLEAKLTTLRNRANQVASENSRLYWFLDWALFDVMGAEMLTGITPSSEPTEKTQCLVDAYKNIKIMLTRRSSEGPTAVDHMAN